MNAVYVALVILFAINIVGLLFTLFSFRKLNNKIDLTKLRKDIKKEIVSKQISNRENLPSHGSYWKWFDGTTVLVRNIVPVGMQHTVEKIPGPAVSVEFFPFYIVNGKAAGRTDWFRTEQFWSNVDFEKSLALKNQDLTIKSAEDLLVSGIISDELKKKIIFNMDVFTKE